MKKLRSKVGMVFQYPEYQLFAETVKEDVAFGLKNFFPDIFISNQPEKLCPLKSRNKNAVFNQRPKKVNKNPFKFIF